MNDIELKEILRDMAASIFAVAEKQNTIFEMLSTLPEYSKTSGYLKDYANLDLKNLDKLKTRITQLKAL